MKIKIYTLSVVAILGFFGAGYMLKDYDQPSYQNKDYSNLLISNGDAKGADLLYKQMRAGADGEIDEVAARKAYLAAQNHSSAKATADRLTFEELGPNFIGGRTRSIIRDNRPGKEAIFYIGAVSGGVFITWDRGEQWYGHSGDLPNLNIGSLAQTADGKLWVGTGCSHNEPFRGDGLYRRSGDDTYPISYERIKSTVDGTAWTYVNQIVGHPTDANKLYVGTHQGLFVSSDASGSEPTFFNPIQVGGNPITPEIHDIDYAVDGNDLIIYVTSGNNTVWKLRDKGGNDVTVESQTVLDEGNGTPSWPAVAVAPSDPNTLYVSIGGSGENNCTYGIFQSKDAGTNWSNIARGGAPTSLYQSLNCQGFWDNDIAVFPTDPGKIIVGGVGIYRWEESKTAPGTGGWYKTALGRPEGTSGSLTDTNYVHSDKHRILIVDSITVYVASDGGIGRSLDGGKTWGQNNNGYNAYQCYSIDAAFGSEVNDSIFGSGSEQVMGGSQDNGTVLIGTNPFRPDAGFDLSGGDGFDCHFSNIANLAFVTVYYGALSRTSFNAGRSSIFSGELSVLCEDRCGPFNTTLDYWETGFASSTLDSISIKIKGTGLKQGDTLNYNSEIGNIPMTYILPKDVSAGDSVSVPDYAQSRLAISLSQGVYMTRDASKLNKVYTQWQRIADGTNSYPDKLAAVPNEMQFSSDGNQLFMLAASRLYRIDNIGQAKDSSQLDVRSPYSVVTLTMVQNFGGNAQGLSVDPNNPENVIVTFGSYGGSNKVIRLSNASSCLSGQGNGVSIQGNLPTGIPVYAGLIADHDNNTVLVGTEFGIYATDDAFSSASPTWNEVWGMPNVPVYAMVQQTNQYLYGENGPKLFENSHYRKIYAGTHGRGYWRTASLVGIDDKDEDNTIANKKAIGQFKVYPNPMNETGNIEITLTQSQRVSIDIYDLSGKRVNSINNEMMQAGKNKIQFNATELRNGTYIATMRIGEEVKVSKFVVMR